MEEGSDVVADGAHHACQAQHGQDRFGTSSQQILNANLVFHQLNANIRMLTSVIRWHLIAPKSTTDLLCYVGINLAFLHNFLLWS